MSQKGTSTTAISRLKRPREVQTVKYTTVGPDSKRELIVQLRNSKY